MSAAARKVSPPSPVLVSQHTSEAVIGLPARRYLELLRSHAIPSAPVGKLRLARVDDILEALGLDPDSRPRGGKPGAESDLFKALGLRRKTRP